jgi:REP element-mobilizing transposase RayT
MPRPLRIEYENAFYHVMNRGRGRSLIFHNEKYYKAFLETLNEVHIRFDCIIHAYCLMGNHYHILLETPHANLSRIMRHINGVYTQRYNRLKNTDGSLFRGRFKAILVDKDEYIMQLSRYIHRNPIDMKKPLVTNLSEYQWSSYRAYINKEKAPKWLNRDFTFDILAHRQKYKAYEEFTMQGSDKEMQEIYSKKYLPSILGQSGFKEWVYEKLLTDKSAEEKIRIIKPLTPMHVVVDCVAKYYNVDADKIRKKTVGKQLQFEARKVAMYLCQELCGVYLKEIQKYFNLNHIGSVSFNTSTLIVHCELLSRI